MKKRRIVLASVLKPVTDTRMSEKLATSLAKVEGYEVTIIGYPAPSQPTPDLIQRIPLKTFNRLSIGRLLASWRVLKNCLKLKPELLIVNTHELLTVSIVNRILFGTKIVYDIQENYARNILHTPAFARPLRPVLAGWVRLKERLLTPLFHGVLLAEKCYENELPFVRSKSVVLENKAVVPANFNRHPPADKIRLAFTGTLAESTGVFQAISLAQKLHHLNPKIELEIIGYCARQSTLLKIKSAIAGCTFIKLIGGDQLVPHTQILETIRTATFGIICYPTAPHTHGKMPTKLYEYLACQLPILLQPEPAWVQLCAPSNAALVVDFNNPDLGLLLAQLDTPRYTAQPENVTWPDEEARFLDWVRKFLI
ncbi:MAG: glycosyltransferase [Cyclobacteriaceae bacterium]|nr:glycosyltransferase [Cyclobacteriaceae bacterium]